METRRPWRAMLLPARAFWCEKSRYLIKWKKKTGDNRARDELDTRDVANEISKEKKKEKKEKKRNRVKRIV